MKTALFATVVSAAVVGALPASEEPSSMHSFDKREDTSFLSLGGKVLKTDLYAGVAGINQQLYQAKKSEQWKKCNPTNIVVRREWYSLFPLH